MGVVMDMVVMVVPADMVRDTLLSFFSLSFRLLSPDHLKFIFQRCVQVSVRLKVAKLNPLLLPSKPFPIFFSFSQLSFLISSIFVLSLFFSLSLFDYDDWSKIQLEAARAD